MTVDDLIAYGKGKVHSDLAKMLLADLLDINSLELLTILDKEIDEKIVYEYKRRVDELREGRPIQYIIGNVNFYGNKIIVDERVLIPRFETEQLVEKTINRINILFKTDELSIIDLGTGSGAIGLALKSKLPNSKVDLLDISTDALDVAKINAKNLGLEVNIIQNDMLENIDKKYDVIISNPPYIRTDEEIEDIVRDNEPRIALFGGKDGLDFYRKILSDITKNLKDKYLIAFEMGDLQKDGVTSIAKEFLPNANIDCLKDLSNRDRMIFIYN